MKDRKPFDLVSGEVGKGEILLMLRGSKGVIALSTREFAPRSGIFKKNSLYNFGGVGLTRSCCHGYVVVGLLCFAPSYTLRRVFKQCSTSSEFADDLLKNQITWLMPAQAFEV